MSLSMCTLFVVTLIYVKKFLIADNFGLDFYDDSLFCGRRMIGLRYFTGTVKGSYYFTSGLIMDD